MMEIDEVSDAVGDIHMMVQVLLKALDTLQANQATPRMFELPYDEGQMADFAANDLYKRVTALRDGLT